MPNDQVFRQFDCMGLCGETVAIPAKYATAFVRANGNLVANAYLVCDACDTWIRDAIENAHSHTPAEP
jgi:hypothetical protein